MVAEKLSDEFPNGGPTWQRAVKIAMQKERFECEKAEMTGMGPDVNKVGFFQKGLTSTTAIQAIQQGHAEVNAVQEYESDRKDQPREVQNQRREEYATNGRDGEERGGQKFQRQNQHPRRDFGRGGARGGFSGNRRYENGNRGSKTQQVFNGRKFLKGHLVTLKLIFTKLKELFDKNEFTEEERIYIQEVTEAVDGETTEDEEKVAIAILAYPADVVDSVVQMEQGNQIAELLAAKGASDAPVAQTQ
jgi:hypothetical protein